MHTLEFPIVKVCRTKRADGSHWLCLVSSIFICPHQLHVGDHYYCMHYKNSSYENNNADCPKEDELT